MKGAWKDGSADAQLSSAPRVKGISLRNAVDALVALHGPAALERALPRAPEEVAVLVRQGRILAGNWYPLTHNSGLLRAIDESTPGGRELMQRLGAHSMKKDITGVYRTFSKLFGPDRTLKVSTRLFNHYYDTGHAEIVESRPGFALARWTGCTGFEPRIFQVMIGSCQSLLECVGAQHVRTRLHAGAQEGDDFCELAAYWK